MLVFTSVPISLNDTGPMAGNEPTGVAGVKFATDVIDNSPFLEKVLPTELARLGKVASVILYNNDKNGVGLYIERSGTGINVDDGGKCMINGVKTISVNAEAPANSRYSPFIFPTNTRRLSVQSAISPGNNTLGYLIAVKLGYDPYPPIPVYPKGYTLFGPGALYA
jgi:hypothetical protein